MLLPIVFLLIGIILANRIQNWADSIIRVGLTVLLLGIGLNVGNDAQLFRAIPRLGFQSLIFCLSASVISIVLVMLWEKLFLKEYSYAHASSEEVNFSGEYRFVFLVMIFFTFGIVMGRQTNIFSTRGADLIIELALISIYIGIGVSMKFAIHTLLKERKAYYVYVLLPVIITIGSLVGGLLAGIISGENLRHSAAIGGGMAFYSLATAMVTDQAGLHLGLIAFISNFLRELLTFILAPFLAQYSNMAPIALGGASTMDTTLAIMKQNLNEKYTLVAFFNGVILSFVVPLVLILLLR